MIGLNGGKISLSHFAQGFGFSSLDEELQDRDQHHEGPRLQSDQQKQSGQDQELPLDTALHHEQDNDGGGAGNDGFLEGGKVSHGALALNGPDELLQLWMTGNQRTKDAVLFIQLTLKLGSVGMNLPTLLGKVFGHFFQRLLEIINGHLRTKDRRHRLLLLLLHHHHILLDRDGTIGLHLCLIFVVIVGDGAAGILLDQPFVVLNFGRQIRLQFLGSEFGKEWKVNRVDEIGRNGSNHRPTGRSVGLVFLLVSSTNPFPFSQFSHAHDAFPLLYIHTHTHTQHTLFLILQATEGNRKDWATLVCRLMDFAVPRVGRRLAAKCQKRPTSLHTLLQ